MKFDTACALRLSRANKRKIQDPRIIRFSEICSFDLPQLIALLFAGIRQPPVFFDRLQHNTPNGTGYKEGKWDVMPASEYTILRGTGKARLQRLRYFTFSQVPRCNEYCPHERADSRSAKTLRVRYPTCSAVSRYCSKRAYPEVA